MIDRQTWTAVQTDRQTDMESSTDRDMDSSVDRQIWTAVQTDRETDMDSSTDRQTRTAVQQTDRHGQQYRQTDRHGQQYRQTDMAHRQTDRYLSKPTALIYHLYLPISTPAFFQQTQGSSPSEHKCSIL